MLRLSGLSQQQTHLLSADGFQTQRNASTLILHVKMKPLRVAELCTYKMKLWTSSRYNRKRVLSMAIKGQYTQCTPETWRDQTHAILWTSTEDSPKYDTSH